MWIFGVFVKKVACILGSDLAAGFPTVCRKPTAGGACGIKCVFFWSRPVFLQTRNHLEGVHHFEFLALRAKNWPFLVFWPFWGQKGSVKGAHPIAFYRKVWGQFSEDALLRKSLAGVLASENAKSTRLAKHPRLASPFFEAPLNS